VGTFEATVDGEPQSSGPIVDDPYGEYGEQPKAVPDQSLYDFHPRWITHYRAKSVNYRWPSSYGERAESGASASTQVKLYTGGKARVGRKSLFRITAWAREYGRPLGRPDSHYAWLSTPDEAVPHGKIRVLGETPDAESHVYVELADNQQEDLTVTARGVKHYFADATAEKLRLEVTDVTFGHDPVDLFIKEDISGTNLPPMWTKDEVAGTEVGYPILYVSGDTMWTGTDFKNVGGGAFPVRVKGETVVGGTKITLWGDLYPPYLNPRSTATTEADVPLTPNKVDFCDPMTIKWKYAHPSRMKFIEAGRSTNQLYVTWKTPASSDILVHTFVHLACSNPGGTDFQSVFNNTWQNFAGPADVTTWNGIPLYYYKEGLSFSNTHISAWNLVSKPNHNGQCMAWADLLAAALAVNGCSSSQFQYARITPPYDAEYLLIKSWTFGAANASDPQYGWQDEATKTSDGDPEMVPLSGVTGPVSPSSGVAGQNSPTPAEKIFTQHFVIKNTADSKYYDPSYGKIYLDATDFEAQAIKGYGRKTAVQANPEKVRFEIRQPDGGFQLPTITPIPWPE
jgi:hypothetical protein